MAAKLHKVAASARELLIDRAAAQWKVDAANYAGCGQCASPPDRAFHSYGELADEDFLNEQWSEDAPGHLPRSGQ